MSKDRTPEHILHQLLEDLAFEAFYLNRFGPDPVDRKGQPTNKKSLEIFKKSYVVKYKTEILKHFAPLPEVRFEIVEPANPLKYHLQKIKTGGPAKKLWLSDNNVLDVLRGDQCAQSSVDLQIDLETYTLKVSTTHIPRSLSEANEYKRSVLKLLDEVCEIFSEIDSNKRSTQADE